MPNAKTPRRNLRAADARERSVPAAPMLLLVQLVSGRGIAREQLLGPLGLREDALEEPHARLPVEVVDALIERARVLTGEPGLGFHLGLARRVTSYGYLGFAAMSAATVGQALDLTIRFLPTLTDVFSLRLEVDGDLAAVVVDLHTDFGRSEDAFLISAAVSMWQIASALTGKALCGSTELTIAEPRYFRRFHHVLPNTRFRQSRNRLVFDASWLELPLLSADRSALRLAAQECQGALDALVSDSGFVQRVRMLVARPRDAAASITEAAAKMRVSPRTLKRRLAAHGLSFTELLADERREAALRLLSTSDLTIDAIAKRLGYSRAPNFIRAFRRWTGDTPSAYRRTTSRVEQLASE